MPGLWAGYLVLDRGMSPVATLVERSTRYLLLVALRAGNHKADAVADALAAAVAHLSTHLAKSLTWARVTRWPSTKRFTHQTGIQIYFCDPRSSWQRGSNENTNGLLRQHIPRRLDFRTLSQHDLDVIALELNDRPRQTLRFKTPSQAKVEVLR